MTIRVLLVDDHAMVRDGLRLLLNAEADFTVVGEATNGREAVRQAQHLQPDVVVMDIAMPELNGIEATRQIRETVPTAQVIILSMHSSAEHVFQAQRAGALGYVLKESAGPELVDSIRTVHVGRRYISLKLAQTTTDDQIFRDKSPLERLSAREREVLQLAVESKSNVEIGRILSLSPKSVATYRSRLALKLGIRDLPGLVKFAIEHGLTPPS